MVKKKKLRRLYAYLRGSKSSRTGTTYIAPEKKSLHFENGTTNVIQTNYSLAVGRLCYK